VSLPGGVNGGLIVKNDDLILEGGKKDKLDVEDDYLDLAGWGSARGVRGMCSQKEWRGGEKDGKGNKLKFT